PAQDPVRAAWVFAGTMGMLILPKFLAYAALLVRPRERRATGGTIRTFAGMVVEIVVSGLMAPVMMLLQTRAVGEVLMGRDSGWNAQRRDDGTLPLGELLAAYGWATLLGVLLGAGAWLVSAPLFLWMMPVLVGLVLAIPLVAWTSDARAGRRMRALGLLSTPEENTPPPVLTRANALAERGDRVGDADTLAALLADRGWLDLHMGMLPEVRRQRRRAIDGDALVAIAKIDDCDTLAEVLEDLSPRERFAALGSRDAMQRLIAKARQAPRAGGDD
ncbi:MAG: glucan biosynthesis glucosyltransferase H, partial [Rhizobiales bacterium]|nr:glucan biosynthesis glucosyltransferase H [Hyphomicrobiales bacterium]